MDIEPLPAFGEVPVGDRSQLFVHKLRLCSVVFDFNDPSADLRGKQIKAQALHEMLEYITSQRGVITEAIYPEICLLYTSPSPRDS